MRYPQVNVNNFNEGSPERALVEYLICWKSKDWKSMADHTQLTWKTTAVKNYKKTIDKTLKDRHISFIIKGIKIFESIIPSGFKGEVVKDIRFKIYYKQFEGGKKKTREMLARLIKEEVPFAASKNGTWGVNPVSILRK